MEREVVGDSGGEIRQPDGVGVVVGVVFNCSACKWRYGNDGLEGRGLYSQRVGPGLWYQPVLKVGIGTGLCQEPVPMIIFQQPKGRETATIGTGWWH